MNDGDVIFDTIDSLRDYQSGTASPIFASLEVYGESYFSSDAYFSGNVYLYGGSIEGSLIGSFTAANGHFQNTSSPAAPTSGVTLYSLSNRLKAKFPSGRVADVGGAWSKTFQMTGVAGTGATTLAFSFAIPAGIYEVDDIIEVSFTTSHGSPPIPAIQYRINGGPWGGNMGLDVQDGVALVTIRFSKADASTMIVTGFRSPTGGGYPHAAQTGYSMPAAGAALTLDIGLNFASGASLNVWHAVARLIKGTN